LPTEAVVKRTEKRVVAPRVPRLRLERIRRERADIVLRRGVDAESDVARHAHARLRQDDLVRAGWEQRAAKWPAGRVELRRQRVHGLVQPPVDAALHFSGVLLTMHEDLGLDA